MYFTNGYNYEGMFLDDKFSWQGILRDVKRGETYTGEWKDNKMHGKGIFTWKDGRKYDGEYVDDK